MAVDPSLTDNGLAFLQTVSKHWIVLAIGALLVIDAMFSPFFSRDRPPERRRVAMLTAGSIAFVVASFQAFSDEHATARRANQLVDTYRGSVWTQLDQARSERDNLAAQLSASQKELAESRAVAAAPIDRLENGTQQHPFSDKARCPPGSSIVDGPSVGMAGRQPSARDRSCFVRTSAPGTSGEKGK